MIVVSGNTYSTLSFWWFHVVLQTSEFQALNDSTTFNRRSVWIQEILRNGECLANNYDPARDLANGATWHKLHCLAKVNWARRICFGSSRDDWKIKSLRVRLNIDQPQARIGSTRLFLWFWGQGIPFRDTQWPVPQISTPFIVDNQDSKFLQVPWLSTPASTVQFSTQYCENWQCEFWHLHCKGHIVTLVEISGTAHTLRIRTFGFCHFTVSTYYVKTHCWLLLSKGFPHPENSPISNHLCKFPPTFEMGRYSQYDEVSGSVLHLQSFPH